MTVSLGAIVFRGFSVTNVHFERRAQGERPYFTN